MRVLPLVVAVSLAVSLSPALRFHPGRTDANGGHTDSSTGEYHYHHGYSAHQHTDLDGDGKPDCPYTFTFAAPPEPTAAIQTTEPVTVSRSFSATSSSGSSTPTVKTVKSESTGGSSWLIGFAFAVFVVIMVIIQRVSSHDKNAAIQLLRDDVRRIGETAQAEAKKHKETVDRLNREIQSLRSQLAAAEEIQNENSELKSTVLQHQNTISNLTHEIEILKSTNPAEKETDAIKKRFDALIAANDAKHKRDTQALEFQLHTIQNWRNELYASLASCYGPGFLLPVSGAPRNVSFDSAGLPHLINYRDSSDAYVFYRSASGKLHTHKCQHHYGCKKVHAIYIDQEDFYSNACLTCRPKYPDLSWHSKYLQLERIAK